MREPAGLSVDQIQRLANEIADARRRHVRLETGSARFAIDIDTAYAVQRRLLETRLETGQRQCGWKIGYTSQAMRDQMGVQEPNFGPLMEQMVLGSGAVLPETVTQPRVEPEIAVVLAQPVTPNMNLQEVRRSCQRIACALEVVDPVWSEYRFTHEENTADGSSAAYVVIGEDVSAEQDLADINVTLRRNGRVAETGSTRAVMDHPLRAVRWLAMALRERGLTLREGDLIMTGGVTRAVELAPGGSVAAVFASVGEVSVRRSPS